MKLCRIRVFIIALIVLTGCKDEDQPELSIFTSDFDFNAGQHDWAPGFADYPANTKDSAAFELQFAYSEPIKSKLSKRSVMLSGKNINRDLFMYIKRKITGLKPSTDYTLTFNVEVTSDLQSVMQAYGGSVLLKAGATNTEPKSVIERDQYVMNIDKGDQTSAGEDMILLGDLFSEGAAYSLVTLSNTVANSRYVARTNSNGELWLIVGTDSTIAGTTKVFYTRIKVLFSVS